MLLKLEAGEEKVHGAYNEVKGFEFFRMANLHFEVC